MNKKNLLVFLSLIILLLVILIIAYPSFYNVPKNDTIQNDSISETRNDMEQIDILSNLSFFKILVEDTSSKDGLKYSEKVVTIRDNTSISELQKLISTAEVFVTDDARGYDAPTTVICYLDDNTVCTFFVSDSNLIVFSDVNSEKTMYKLNSDINIDKFLSTLYNTNVNASTYSIFGEAGKYGVKYNNKVVVDPIYDDVAIINPNIDVFGVTENNITTFVDKFGQNPFTNLEDVQLISGTGGGESLWYENALKFKENGKYGLIGLDGLSLLSAEYDKIEALNYVKDYLVITKNGKNKVIKLINSGFEEITGEFDSIKILGADLDYTSKDEKYLNSNSTVILGINNGIREQYFELDDTNLESN